MDDHAALIQWHSHRAALGARLEAIGRYADARASSVSVEDTHDNGPAAHPAARQGAGAH